MSQRRPPVVDSKFFAGRLGGNQQFTVSSADEDYDEVVQKIPDSVPNSNWPAIFDLKPFTELALWKLAFIEGMGLAIQVFIGGLLGVGLVPTATETSVGGVLPAGLAAISNLIMIVLFIYVSGPVTGAHFNPLITIGAFLTRLSSLPRTVLYITFQCLGAVVGAFVLRASLGASPEQLAIIPGCYIDPSIVTPGEAFAFETMASFSTLFLAFGLGLDPRNLKSFPAALGPILVGLSGALLIFAGGIARKGYLGASNNPARCLGLMAAADRFTYHYIHWTGTIAASMINAILYWAVPPYKKV